MDEGEAKRLEEGHSYRYATAWNDDDHKEEREKPNDMDLEAKEHVRDKEITVNTAGIELNAEEEEEKPQVKQKSKRVATLDAFRGLTIVLMILVDDAGGAYPRIDHSPWNGCTLADVVMPFFLFIVGVAIALAFKRVPKIKDAVKRIFVRTLKLIFWGILLQGGYSHAPDDLSDGVNMKIIRWCGILQRIALVYCVVALIEAFTAKQRPASLSPGLLSIFRAYKWQWFGGFVAFLIYMITAYTVYVPDWSFVDRNENEHKRYTVICGVRGDVEPACNAVGYVDRQVWGINDLYAYPVWRRLKVCSFSSRAEDPLRDDAPAWCRAPFEPEGLLSSISAIMSGTIGIHYGHVLIHFKDHSQRLKQWVSMGFALLIVAIILHFTDAIPLNKQLYSFSYVCFTAGAAGIVFSGLYVLINVWGFRTPFLFLEWIGMNAMLVYVLGAQGIFAAFVNGWYYEDPKNSLVHWIHTHVFVDVWHSERVGTLLYVIFAEITFWAVVSGILHKLGIYWKL
ncbi:hypothetical protein QN277_021331 [Acacia crassicarpa]|uniref:Heparan-alpha-glucosaminide N-acetyltransferase catalytic domain-containing protein n=1 Tax=Acacia crassicarpa TaxID=499986 RepID=A0AAE1MSZ5_9FABA|nr:hypothetical protein QN277_021331 [Acacia crassicarpa]